MQLPFPIIISKRENPLKWAGNAVKTLKLATPTEHVRRRIDAIDGNGRLQSIDETIIWGQRRESSVKLAQLRLNIPGETRKIIKHIWRLEAKESDG